MLFRSEARRERVKVFVELVLPGGGQRRDRASVERALERDDRRAAGAVLVAAVLAGDLDGALIGLSAAVGEEYPVQINCHSLSGVGRIP